MKILPKLREIPETQAYNFAETLSQTFSKMPKDVLKEKFEFFKENGYQTCQTDHYLDVMDITRAVVEDLLGEKL